MCFYVGASKFYKKERDLSLFEKKGLKSGQVGTTVCVQWVSCVILLLVAFSALRYNLNVTSHSNAY